MSLADIIATSHSSDPDDHLFIPRLIEDRTTPLGGYQVWASGCICGFYFKGYESKSYIPSEASARRIWDDHLRLETGGDIIPIPVQETDDRDELDYSGLTLETRTIIQTCLLMLHTAGLTEREAITTLRAEVERLAGH